MTVDIAVPEKVTGVGNGVATLFSFSPMVIYTSSDMTVTHVAADGTETLLTEGAGASNYAVIVSQYPGAGSITYPADEVTPMPSGESLVMKPVYPLEQATNLENQGGYHPDIQETQFDKLLRIAKQQGEVINRAFRLPISVSSSVSGELPPPEALKFFRWNAGADALENVIAGLAVISDDLPLVDGIAAAGSSTDVPRADHVHPLASAETETLTNKTMNDATNFIHADGVHVTCRNVSGGDLAAGTPVYISGWNVGQGAIEIEPADADNAGTFPALGILDEAILDNANGDVLVSGVIENIDASGGGEAWAVGDSLYLSTTAGELTNVRPMSHTAAVQAIAKVMRNHATEGVIMVQGAGRVNDIPNGLFIDTNTTITVASSGGDYTSLQDALDVVEHWIIAEDVTLTISVADEIISEAAEVIANLPYGNQIVVQGATTTALTLTSLTSITSNGAGDHDVIIKFADVSAVTNGRFLKIILTTGTGDHENLQGIWKITNVNVGTDELTIKVTDKRASFNATTLTGGTYTYIPSVLQWAGTSGFTTRMPITFQDITLEGDNTASKWGVLAGYGGTITLQSRAGINGFARCAYGIFGGHIISNFGAVSNAASNGWYIIDNAELSGSATIATGCENGYVASAGGHMAISQCVAAGNGTNIRAIGEASNIICNSADILRAAGNNVSSEENASVDLASSTISGAGAYGVDVSNGGYADITGVTFSGNTSGDVRRPNGGVTWDGTDRIVGSVQVGEEGSEKDFEGSATASLTFGGGSIAAGATATETITVTGAIAGDDCNVTPPSVSLVANWDFFATAATNAVTIRIFNKSASSQSAPSGTWRATVRGFS